MHSRDFVLHVALRVAHYSEFYCYLLKSGHLLYINFLYVDKDGSFIRLPGRKTFVNMLHATRLKTIIMKYFQFFLLC
jgi:hypothetical protein